MRLRGAQRPSRSGECPPAPRDAGPLTTVFAGQDTEAAARARSYFTGYAPSSPQIGLLKDGKLVFMLERYQIEGRTADQIAHDLVDAFDQYCAA